MPSTQLLPTLLILLAFLTLASAKVYSSHFAIPFLRRQGCWVFLDRMHLEPGSMKLHVELKLTANTYKENSLYEFEVVAIPQSVWPISVANKCDREKFSDEEALTVNNKELSIHADLFNGNGYSYTTRSSLEITQAETYHFVLRHCSKKIIADGYARDVKLELYLDAQNNDQHHSSTQSIYGWLLPLLVGLGGFMLRQLYKDKEDDGDNWVKWILKISLWIAISSIVFKYIGFILYAYVTGSEYQFFDFMFLLLHSVSDSTIIVILLLLAFGWTVTFNNSMDFDLYVPLACMLGFVNIIMTVLNKITDGDHEKYHMFDTIPAYIMIGFRLLGFSIFLGGIIKVSLKIKPEETGQRRYFTQLGILGALHLTFLPALIFLITYIDARYRKETLYFLIELSRFGLNFWLVILSGSKSSAYRKIIDKSFMEKGDKYY